MARRTGLGWAGVLAALTLSGLARANPEPMSVYDGRSMAMGGTGVADNDSMAAVVLNPANFDMVKKFTATLDFTGLSPTFTSPVITPPSTTPVQTTTATQVTPLFLAGAAYRLFDPLVIGLAAYIAEGSGATYSDTDKFTFGQLEVSLPISYRIIEGLSIGIQPRFGYAKADINLPPGPMSPPTSGSLNGTGWGVTAGINWRPMDSLKLGFAWRSKMSIDLKGPITLTFPPPFGAQTFSDSTTNFATPNTLRLGAAWSVLKDLTLAPELRWAAFSGSNQSRTITLAPPPPPPIPGSTTIPQNWKNSWTGALGVEYRLLGMLALRVGGTVGNSATPSSTTSAFDVPPGTTYSVGGGVGVQVIETLQIDAGIFDQWGKATVTDNSPNGIPGDYSLSSLFFALSATMRI